MSAVLWWVLYCTAVSGVLALGAHALETGARAAGRSGRHAWLAALLASVLIPIVSYFRPVVLPAPAPAAVQDFAVTVISPGDAGRALPSALPFHPGLLLWCAATLTVLLFVAYGYARLTRARRTWISSSVDGVPVLLSDDTGPAALGVMRSAIVLPRWVLALESRARSLMLLHEREHLRAWDPRVTLAAVLLAALMPWNVFMWLMVRRLRLAIELDCDARVLAQNPDPVRYGAVLLEVGRRRSGGGFALSTLVEPRSQLERRIRRMAEWPGQTRTPRALGLVALAALLTGGAYAAKSPLHSPNAVVFDDAGDAGDAGSAGEAGGASGGASGGTSGAASSGASGAASAAAAGDAAGGTLAIRVAARDTVRPRLLNREDVLAAAAKQSGVNATGMMRIYIDTTGRAESAPSDDATSAFNDAVERLANVMRFSPAVVDGRKVGMWVSFNVRFGNGASALSAPSTYDAVPGQPPAPPVPAAPPAPVPPPATAATASPPALRDGAPPPPPAPPTAVPAAPRLAAPAPPTPGVSKPAPAPAPKTASPAATAPRPKAAPKPAPPKIVPPSGSVPSPAPRVSQKPQVPSVAVAVIDTPPPTPSVVALENGPVFTPMSVAPRLLNRDTVAAAVARAYPAAMRDAGIGGTTVMWVLLDDQGRTVKFQVNKSSGYPLLDQAALKVVPAMRFSAAQMQDKPIAVWVMVPIVFAIG
ncbi:MAG TPA: M56 family metallopeptidase [Longimicrobiales bacterium]